MRLWQTFRNIDLQTAIKLHEEKPAAKTSITPHSQDSDPVLAFVNSSSRHPSVGSIKFADRFTFSGTVSLSLFRLSKDGKVVFVPDADNDVTGLPPADQPESGRDLLDYGMYDTNRQVRNACNSELVDHRRFQVNIHERDQDEDDEHEMRVQVLQPLPNLHPSEHFSIEATNGFPRQRKQPNGQFELINHERYCLVSFTRFPANGSIGVNPSTLVYQSLLKRFSSSINTRERSRLSLLRQTSAF